MASKAWILAALAPLVAGAATIGALAWARRRGFGGLGESQKSSCPYCGHEIVCDVAPNICNSYQAHSEIMKKLRKHRGGKTESIWVGILDARNRLMKLAEVARGSVNQAGIRPREFFAPAITSNAAAVFLVHNHPSGDTTPSPEDDDLTKRLVEAGKLLGIPVLDHLVVAKVGYYSFRDRGRIIGA
jgi:DNA repair protein RadC